MESLMNLSDEYKELLELAGSADPEEEHPSQRDRDRGDPKPVSAELPTDSDADP
jgi:hypothetical protein